MNPSVESGAIEQMRCGANFAYVLSDSGDFMSTEYKVLQNQGKSCFIRCMKTLYNGKVQLYYLTQGYRTLSSMLPGMDADGFLAITGNLFADILEVKSNGFLSTGNIDTSFDHIYVDQNTHKVMLIYIPVKRRFFDDGSAFENELRTALVKLISETPALSESDKVMKLSSELKDGTMSLDDIYSALGSKVSSPGRGAVRPARSAGARLVAINAPTQIEIAVTKPEFIIGKKRSEVDGAVTFNNMISRVHCKIVERDGQYYIADLNSANGTFVNAVRVRPDTMQHIKNGDIVRLANSDFRVVIL